eukprot:6507941-Prymnesium_polylepis.1
MICGVAGGGDVDGDLEVQLDLLELVVVSWTTIGVGSLLPVAIFLSFLRIAALTTARLPPSRRGVPPLSSA